LKVKSLFSYFLACMQKLCIKHATCQRNERGADEDRQDNSCPVNQDKRWVRDGCAV